MPKTVRDLIEATGIGKNAAYAAVQRGELPGYKVGGRVVIPDEVFDDFLHGRWTPKPRPMVIRPIVQPRDLIRKVG